VGKLVLSMLWNGFESDPLKFTSEFFFSVLLSSSLSEHSRLDCKKGKLEFHRMKSIKVTEIKNARNRLKQ